MKRPLPVIPQINFLDLEKVGMEAMERAEAKYANEKKAGKLKKEEVIRAVGQWLDDAIKLGGLLEKVDGWVIRMFLRVIWSLLDSWLESVYVRWQEKKVAAAFAGDQKAPKKVAKKEVSKDGDDVT